MRTYYIVKHHKNRSPHWEAHKRGFWSTFGKYNNINCVLRTYSYSADECEKELRRVLDPIKPEVVRVVRI